MSNYYSSNKDLRFHLTHPDMKDIVMLKEKGFKDRESCNNAPLDYEDAMDNYDQVMDIIGDICDQVIAANAKSVDEEGPSIVDEHVVYAKGTAENHRVLVDAGMIGMTLQRKYGGLNFPIVPYVMAGEMISRADAGFANIWGLQDCAETIHAFASDEIKDEFLPRFHRGATAAMDLTEPDAGSDLQTVQLKATYDEAKEQWYLDGVKRFITNGDADISLVLARSEAGTSDGRGLSLFVYDRSHKAVSVRRIEHKLGIQGSPTCELVFTHAPAQLIGNRRMGLIKYVMALMNSARLGVGGQSVGIAQAAYEEALKYARERVQFGKPIIEFPAVYEMLTDMQTKLRAMRSLLYETARYVDLYKCYEEQAAEQKLEPEERRAMKRFHKLADFFTPMLKLMASEYCNGIAYDGLQIHGGTGYMKDFPIERIYRDARITSIYEGTSQLQVVAAIRGVTTGLFLERILEYEAVVVKPEFDHLKRHLLQMRKEYEKTVQHVLDKNDENNELVDFHSRRMVEMAAHIIMGFLLVLDSDRDDEYSRTAEIYVHNAVVANRERAAYIKHMNLKEISIFKYA